MACVGSSGGDNAQVLTDLANTEIGRQPEERVRSFLVGANVGGAGVFHIGSPSDQTGSDFQSVRNRSTGLAHPTSSPVFFGPRREGHEIPERSWSSPGNMSDVAGSAASFCGGRLPLPPGLPLTDPPRVTGAYGVNGVPAYDPDFGFAVRLIVRSQHHRLHL